MIIYHVEDTSQSYQLTLYNIYYIECQPLFISIQMYVYTVVPLYVATLARGHPSYEATISGHDLRIIVFNIPVMRGHPSNKARFSIPQGWPCKRGYRGIPETEFL